MERRPCREQAISIGPGILKPANLNTREPEIMLTILLLHSSGPRREPRNLLLRYVPGDADSSKSGILRVFLADGKYLALGFAAPLGAKTRALGCKNRERRKQIPRSPSASPAGGSG